MIVPPLERFTLSRRCANLTDTFGLLRKPIRLRMALAKFSQLVTEGYPSFCKKVEA